MSAKKTDKLLREAYAAHQSQQANTAERLYKKLLRASPRDSDARNLLGLLYIQERRFAEAAQQIRRAIATTPGVSQSHYNLGAALVGTGHPVEAAEQFTRSLELDPGNRTTELALSSALNSAGAEAAENGDLIQALEHYAAAINHDPANATAKLNLGNLQEQTGDFAAAQQSFKAAIAADPQLADAHFQLAHLKHHPSTDDDIVAMTKLFESESLDASARAMLAFGIAKANEKLQRYDTEFSWLITGHKLKQSFESYDAQASKRLFKQTKNVFSIGAIDSELGDGGKDLVFVVGMPRSGTSLAEQILASHSQIFGAGEAISVANLDVKPGMTKQEIARLAKHARKTVTARAGRESVFVETTPVNFLHLGKIATLFPEARIVVCDRDPLDTCLSIYQHPLSASHAYAHNLQSLGEYYSEYLSLIEHWSQTLPNPMLTLRYESLVDAFEPAVAELLEFCGVQFEEQCLHFHETERQVKTPSASQVRQPIYKNSVGRWRRYECELEPLRLALLGN